MMVFGEEWFRKHQRKIVWALNAPLLGRWLRGVLRIEDKERIDWILPNAIFRSLGNGLIRAEYRTHGKYGKRLYHAFRPVWYFLHAWDYLFGTLPELNFGFDTLTAYPETGSGGSNVTFDGTIANAWNGGAGPAWTSMVQGTVDQFSSDFTATNTANGRGCYHRDCGTSDHREVDRAIAAFDTSSMLSGASTSAGTFSLYAVPGSKTKPNVGITGYTLAANNTVASSDWGNRGTTRFASDISAASLGTSGYKDFTLNASGLAYIKPAGVTVICARTDNDIDASSPGCVDSGVDWYFADNTGTTNDPKLVLTFTPGVGGNAFFMGANF